MTMSVRRALGALTCTLLLGACAGATSSPDPSAAPSVAIPPSPAPSIASAPAPVSPSPSAVTSSSDGAPAVRRLAGFEMGLPAGTYEYRETTPYTAFTVDDAWQVAWTMPQHFGLRPAELPTGDLLTAWYDMRLSSLGPECAETPLEGAGHTAADIVEGFTTRDGVDATTPKPITVGGLQGQWFDVQVAKGWTQDCPFTPDLPGVTLFLDAGVDGEPAFWGISEGERERFIVLDDGAGSNVIVMIDSTAGKTFDQLVEVSQPVIDSMRFAGTSD